MACNLAHACSPLELRVIKSLHHQSCIVCVLLCLQKHQPLSNDCFFEAHFSILLHIAQTGSYHVGFYGLGSDSFCLLLTVLIYRCAPSVPTPTLALSSAPAFTLSSNPTPAEQPADRIAMHWCHLLYGRLSSGWQLNLQHKDWVLYASYFKT